MNAKHIIKIGFRKAVSGLILLAFLTGQVVTPSIVQAQVLPEAGTMFGISSAFNPPVLLGLKIHPENPLLFDFIVDQGQAKLSTEELKEETTKLVKYFLAALTIPDKEVWVNLSPYEKDRIIPDMLGQTIMGKTMLEQDYTLKQLAASLTNPDTDLGKKYWSEVNKVKTLDARGLTLGKNSTTSDQLLATNDLTKVWIMPQKAEVLESNGIVIVGEKRLKVMMAEDIQKKLDARGLRLGKTSSDQPPAANVSSEIFRSTILPTIEKQVNEGKDFAGVRQIYNSVILATWYKKALKESLLGKVYADKGKVAGVETDDKQMKERIYKQYVEQFKKGVYNLIKEEETPDGEIIPRKYFSGGIVTRFGEVAGSALVTNPVPLTAIVNRLSTSSSTITKATVLNAEQIPEVDRINQESVSSSTLVKLGTVIKRLSSDVNATLPLVSQNIPIDLVAELQKQGLEIEIEWRDNSMPQPQVARGKVRLITNREVSDEYALLWLEDARFGVYLKNVTRFQLIAPKGSESNIMLWQQSQQTADTSIALQRQMRLSGLIESTDVRLKSEINSQHAASLRQFVHPIAVEKLSDGRVIIGDSTQLTGGAVIYNLDGSTIPLLTENGEALDINTSVKQIAVDENDDIYVATASDGKESKFGIIRKYDSHGNFLGKYEVHRGDGKQGAVNIQGLVAFEDRLYYTAVDVGEFRVLNLRTQEEKVFTWEEILGSFKMYGSMELSLNRAQRVVYLFNSGNQSLSAGGLQLPEIPLRIRKFNIDTQTLSAAKDFKGIGSTGGIARDIAGNVYISDRDRNVIHIGNVDSGYQGYIHTPNDLTVTSIALDKDNNVLLGRSGGFDVLSQAAISQLLVSVNPKLGGEQPSFPLLGFKKEESIGSSAIMNMLPPDHGEIQVLANRPASLLEIMNMIYTGKPHMVSIPIQKLPLELQKLLNATNVISLSGKRMTTYEYLAQNVDEIIFPPFILQSQRDGTVTQIGGVIIHDDMRKPVSQISLTNDPNRPGKRIVYVNPFRYLLPNGQAVRTSQELGLSKRVQLQPIDISHHLVEEIAHFETIRLVVSQELDSRYLDRPNFVWFEKIGQTIHLNFLDSLYTFLVDEFPDRREDAIEYASAYRKELIQRINDFNQALGTSGDYSIPSVVDKRDHFSASSQVSPNPVGGIDFDPSNMNLQIKRDRKGVPLPLAQQDIENINIDGLFPVIINIQPVNAQTLSIFLGQAPQEPLREPELAASSEG